MRQGPSAVNPNLAQTPCMQRRGRIGSLKSVVERLKRLAARQKKATEAA